MQRLPACALVHETTVAHVGRTHLRIFMHVHAALVARHPQAQSADNSTLEAVAPIGTFVQKVRALFYYVSTLFVLLVTGLSLNQCGHPPTATGEIVENAWCSQPAGVLSIFILFLVGVASALIARGWIHVTNLHRFIYAGWYFALHLFNILFGITNLAILTHTQARLDMQAVAINNTATESSLPPRRLLFTMFWIAVVFVLVNDFMDSYTRLMLLYHLRTQQQQRPVPMTPPLPSPPSSVVSVRGVHFAHVLFVGEEGADVHSLHDATQFSLESQSVSVWTPCTSKPLDTCESCVAAYASGMSAPEDHNWRSECSICMESMQQPGHQTLLQLSICKHVFHRACFVKWYRTKASCPLCRHELRRLL